MLIKLVPVIEVPRLFLGTFNGLAFFFIILVKDRYNTKVILHEQCHIKQQWKYWIVGFIFLYVYYLIRYGYRNNPFEIEAREYANI